MTIPDAQRGYTAKVMLAQSGINNENEKIGRGVFWGDFAVTCKIKKILVFYPSREEYYMFYTTHPFDGLGEARLPKKLIKRFLGI